MIISHVVAMSNNNVIGVDNNLPWNLKTDLAHFKEYTSNKIIIMGRKTYESIGRPLPNRTNFIVSRTLNSVTGANVFNNLEDSIKAAKELSTENHEQSEVVIIGGGYLFRDTISTFNKLVLTRVDCNIEGDVYYPSIDFGEWRLTTSTSFKKDSDNDYDFTVEEYIKL
ncbi:MAG: dihydrofolate reductase [Gammaproteobacteria bacterium]|uniref:Dihydrofolate reductase n=1 Tax=SAR86 cluster bacterium TaxID=2030880 RepID=A0A520MQ00_9GAMM|nr:MAG: dihydrofolate reductase [Gammaproteobacteria bacterium TMED242]RZO23260.1 MAG: dihydrofolate reductase [SAR86 cluster bacterium]|tara:strand:- start:8993 stop:9496 length:504 start_codon:yes stop_codon:yes gene_type:complete